MRQTRQRNQEMTRTVEPPCPAGRNRKQLAAPIRLIAVLSSGGATGKIMISQMIAFV